MGGGPGGDGRDDKDKKVRFLSILCAFDQL